MVPVQGFDISAFQSARIDWAAEKARGASFVFHRCLVGTTATRDFLFGDHVSRAKDAGFINGAYLFPYPLPGLDPNAQADAFLKAADVGDHSLGAGPDELPPAFDIEWPPPEQWAVKGCSADQICDWSLTCLTRIESDFGYRPILYTYPYFIQALSKARNFSQLTKYPLWIAGGGSYVNGDGHVPDLDKEKPPAVVGWNSNWLFWQHDGNGGRKLLDGNDADFDVFRYDLATLQALCRTSAQEAGPDEVPTVDASDPVHLARQARAQGIIS